MSASEGSTKRLWLVWIAGGFVVIAAGVAIWLHVATWSWCAVQSRPGVATTQPISYDIDTSGLNAQQSDELRQAVAQTLTDSRGWQRGGVQFVRAGSNAPDFSFRVATSGEIRGVATVCDPSYNCTVGRVIYINRDRWLGGSTRLSLPLAEYRQLIINHEVGHILGFGDWKCYGHGRPAPVMQPQSYGLGGLTANPWPTAVEVADVKVDRQ